mmetsp:Transcript_27430/g.27308  ORF Transcript_27430/g.27308 Transcript_27430/m.27308 type:complete len:100 (-) Transcript_27430:625-924(-)
MPPNSPLVKHITKSYVKHHLKGKLEARMEEEKVPLLKRQNEEKSPERISENKRNLNTPEPEIQKEDLTRCNQKVKELIIQELPLSSKAILKDDLDHEKP